MKTNEIMRWFHTCILVCITVLSAFADERGAVFQETILLTTDRDIYIRGDEIFIGVNYVVSNTNGQQQLSNILYVELFSESSERIAGIKARIIDGHVSTSMKIPEFARSGNYILRAYTKYGRNFSPEGYTFKHLRIFNPEMPLEVKETNYQVRIYQSPTLKNENGQSFYAFKASVNIAHNVDSVDVISADKKICKIDLGRNGIAGCFLNNDPPDPYFLRLYRKKGDSLDIKFPPTPKERTLPVKLLQKKGEVIIYWDTDTGSTHLPNAVVSIYSQDRVKQCEIPLAFYDTVHLDISSSMFKDGINYITVHNKTISEILKHRIIYKYPAPARQSTLEIPADTFPTRGKVTVHTDPGQTVKSQHISVFRKPVHENNPAIHRLLLLNPWMLKDHMKYQYSFHEFREDVHAALTIFEQEQGDSIFDNIHRQELSIKYLPEIRDVTLSGMMLNNEGGIAVRGQKIYASTIFNSPQIHIQETDENGRFVFSINNTSGEIDLFVSPFQLNNRKNNYKLLFDNDFDYRPPNIVFSNCSFKKKEQDYLEQLWLYHQIMSNTKKTKTRQTRKQEETGSLFGQERIFIDMDDYVEVDRMWDVLYEIVPHIKPYKKGGETGLRIFTKNSLVLPGDPLVLVDNIPVFDLDEVLTINPSQIEKIELINKTYIIGDFAINGILLITTNSKYFGGMELPASSAFIDFLSVTKGRSFVEKRYDKALINSPTPDFRSLLFWKSRRDEASSFFFYTSDHPGDFVIRMVYVLESGQIYVARKPLTVEK